MYGSEKGLLNFFKKNSLLVKIILSYLIIGAVLVSILSGYLFYGFSRSSLEEINSISQKMLTQSYNVSQNILTTMYSYFFQMYSKDSILFNALYSNSFEPLEVGEINRKLNSEASSNPWIHSIYIINRHADMVFSNLTTVKSMKEFFDQDIYEYLKGAKQPYSPIFIPRKVKYAMNDKKVETNLISVVFLEAGQRNDPESAMIVNINQQDLQKVFLWNGDHDATRVFIIDRDGTMISHPDNESINTNGYGESHIKRILDSEERSGTFTTDIQGVKSLVTFIKSDKILGWSFISIGEYKMLLKRVNALQHFVFAVTAGFILLGILIAIAFISKIYVPLHRLIQKIRSKNAVSDSQMTLSEYDYLNKTYENLLARVGDLSTSINSYRSAKRNELLRRLVQGEVVWTKETEKELELLALDLNAPWYVVCVLRLDSFYEFSQRYSMDDVALFRFAISNIACEVMSEHFSVESDDSGSDHISLVLCVDGEKEDILGRIMESTRKIQLVVSEYLPLSVTAAIGSFIGDIKEIALSYKDAYACSNYRLTYGRNSVITFREVAQKSNESCQYPLLKEKQLFDALKLAGRERVRKLLNEIVRHIGSFPYDEMMLSLTQLSIASVRVIESTVGQLRERGTLDFKGVTQKLGSFDTLGDIEHWLITLYNEAMDIMEERRDRKKDDLIEKIKEYINQHYSNPSLTVEMVSDFVGLSPNYVRTVFKECTNLSLSNYITELRFEHAKQLLTGSDFPANRISEMVGFQSSGYFYVNFRKCTGKTPDQYRKETTAV